jgi:hypothetical protein
MRAHRRAVFGRVAASPETEHGIGEDGNDEGEYRDREDDQKLERFVCDLRLVRDRRREQIEAENDGFADGCEGQPEGPDDDCVPVQRRPPVRQACL